jgi:hypothetical protein
MGSCKIPTKKYKFLSVGTASHDTNQASRKYILFKSVPYKLSFVVVLTMLMRLLNNGCTDFNDVFKTK